MHFFYDGSSFSSKTQKDLNQFIKNIYIQYMSDRYVWQIYLIEMTTYILS